MSILPAPNDAQSSNAAGWAAIAMLALVVAALEMVAPLPIAVGSMIKLVIACGTLGAVAVWYETVRPHPQFSHMCVALTQVLLFSAVGIVFSYLVARTQAPLWDSRLMAWDQALGFDWMRYLHFVDSSRALTATFHLAYGSLIPQIVVLICALGFAQKVAALRRVMLAAILCGSLCILVSAFFPAISYPAYLGVGAADFKHVNPWGGHAHMADLRALRDGTMTQLDLTAMEGIITFPSYHAGLSSVTMWGFWLTGRRWLQVPGIVLASLTILATPVDGGHYLVDVLAGIAIALISIWVARRAIYWRPAWPVTALPFRRSREASAQ
ncbi:MAG: phosphatase PAP2 family protein [Sphingomicrobium sp.]